MTGKRKEIYPPCSIRLGDGLGSTQIDPMGRHHNSA